MLSYFFNCVDRKIYSHKDIKEGKRVKRMVYLEKGRSRQNLHTHFFYKADTFEEAEKIASIMKYIWHKKIYEAKDIQIIDNTKTTDNRHAYAMKEHYKIDDDIYIYCSLFISNVLFHYFCISRCKQSLTFSKFVA